MAPALSTNTASPAFACVRVIRDRPGGMPHESLVQALNPPGLNARFRECFGRDLPKDFFTLSARETLAVCGVKSKNGAFNALPIEAQFSEHNLENLLVDTEADEPAGAAARSRPPPHQPARATGSPWSTGPIANSAALPNDPHPSQIYCARFLPSRRTCRRHAFAQ